MNIIMVNYELGKIYKISSPSNNLVYYGSTCEKYISTRLAKHLANYKLYLNDKNRYITSFKLLECEDYKVELVEQYPCNNKQQLHIRERYYIENNECVNKVIPTRNIEEYNKKYYQDNRDIRLDNNKKWLENNKERRQEYKKEYNKKYIEANREKILEQNKQYRQANHDKLLEYYKQYYQKNREYKAEKITCECGCKITRTTLSKHRRTNKHLALLEQNKK